jgi:hypothetical protein
MFGAIVRFFKRLFGSKNKIEIYEPVILPEPVEAELPKLIIGTIRSKDENERQMVVGGFVNARDVLYSHEFKEEVLKFKFDPRLTNGHTNQEILDLFTKYSMVVSIEMFTGNFYQNRVSKTQGYEKNEEGFIRANRYFVNTSYSIGSLILHELAHSIYNFSHPNLEQDSVPYGLNRIYEIVAARLKISKTK